ncbi:ThuA domain-containing protein [Sandaracinobacter neustonicus]|uniref:ThuA domain-containing protein n=1 Tax=Sandaracinobacter neustonicus TaxID=1715348 RepID=A0A501XFF0_9SPHN|nr:ThuA domain-containing protein [Sandaracinobacter neustonicus]
MLLMLGAVLGLLLSGGPVRAESQYRLLVIAMPSKYHYEYVPVAREGLQRMARQHAFDMEWAGSPQVLEGDLGGYAAILLLNTPVEDLNPAQRAGFEAYVNGGGNVMIVHRAAIALPANSWPWYERLVGRTVGVHPMLQTAAVTVADRGFPAVWGLPERWLWSDEYYVTTNPYGVRITPVLNVDETSYDPTKIWPGQVAKPMGREHPVAWYHRPGKSRVFVTTLGHDVEAYRDPHYLEQLMGGIWWTATGLGEAR